MPATTPDTLASNALEWARAHITKYGDTDLFPIPFEFECLWFDWTTVAGALVAQDLGAVPNRANRTHLVPKPRGGFRVATQLEPIDSILYAAIGYEAAGRVEASRVDAHNSVACSYRLAPSANGDLFVANADGWTGFQAKSKSLAEHASCSHVVVADIADFYNQIYHHRLHNALESALLPEGRPTNIEKFLGRITAKQSRGIPVGPSTSILFAEACLNDVDQKLMSDGYVHTRYVDDFRIFCRSELEAVKALHAITKYLFTAHRLSLQAHKTRILSTADFIRFNLTEPEEREKKSKIQSAQELIQEAIASVPYGDIDIDEEEFIAENDAKIVGRALQSVFTACMKKPTLPLGLTRYALRRATSLRSRVLVKPVAENLAVLTPVFREAIQYLDRVWNAGVRDNVAPALTQFLARNAQGWLPYLRDWALWLITKRDVLTPKRATAIAEESASGSGMPSRHRAMLARKLGQVEWVREHKETWMSSGPWDRRAVLWAGAVLPRDERRAWLEPVTRSDDLVDAAIAKYVRSMA